MNQYKPKYELKRRGRIYYIYRMEYYENGSAGSPVFESYDYHTARKKLYELYGWKLNKNTYQNGKVTNIMHGGPHKASAMDDSVAEGNRKCTMEEV